MKQKFQIGDEVRIAKKYRNKYNCLAANGVVVQIMTCCDRKHYRVSFEDKAPIFTFYSYELEKVFKDDPEPKFKVGDKVKYIGKQNPLYQKNGEIINREPRLFSGKIYTYDYLMQCPDGDRIWFLEEQLTPCEKPESESKFNIGDKVIVKKHCMWLCNEEIRNNNLVGTISHIYKMPTYTCFEVKFTSQTGKIFIRLLCDYHIEHYIETKQENMNERTVKLTLEKAKEWYKAGGELKEVALQAYSENELSPLPHSWEDFCKRYPIDNSKERVINIFGNPINPNNFDQFQAKGTCRMTGRPKEMSFSVLPSEQHVTAIIALMKLISLRNVWVGDWKPNFKMNMASNWSVMYRPNPGTWDVENHCWTNGGPLTFPTKEMCKEFFECFIDLYEQAKILI